VRTKIFAATAAVTLAVGLVVLWAPFASRRSQALENQAERRIASREVQVSPAELATLMRNRQIALAVFDLRDEPAFNRFHLVDAKRGVPLGFIRALPEQTVKMLVADDEGSALSAYRQLARLGIKQIYVLAGGVPAWLALFAPADAQGTFLAGALGGRHPASFPEVERMQLPNYEPKVKASAASRKGPGGCGG
jgi:rhodanese-related sulfurtransferase